MEGKFLFNKSIIGKKNWLLWTSVESFDTNKVFVSGTGSSILSNSSEAPDASKPVCKTGRQKKNTLEKIISLAYPESNNQLWNVCTHWWTDRQVSLKPSQNKKGQKKIWGTRQKSSPFLLFCLVLQVFLALLILKRL